MHKICKQANKQSNEQTDELSIHLQIQIITSLLRLVRALNEYNFTFVV